MLWFKSVTTRSVILQITEEKLQGKYLTQGYKLLFIIKNGIQSLDKNY